MKKILIAAALLALCTVLCAQEENCFGIIAGKAVTTDGSVLFGHNEDDSGEQMLNINICPADPGYGNVKFIWAEFPGMEIADAYMNEYGVSIASDGCSSREDREDLTDGGILYNVRFDVGKYAKSARDAVRLIGQNVEKYGYRGSGRTYVVADPEEGWIVSVVKGRHWVAQRVPDDKVMTIPNYYTISRVDLSDTANFAGSADLVDYAVERGWYNPEKDGEFNFRLAYSEPKYFATPGNVNRHRKVLEYITDGKYDYDPFTVEFAVDPARKLDVQDLINALSLHSDADSTLKHPVGVCTDVTIISTVFQLRNWLPRSVGCVMWACPGRPCSEAFVPWYLGMTKAPKGWARFADWKEAEQKHFSDASDKRINYPDGYYWKYTDRWDALSADYSSLIGARSSGIAKLQKKFFDAQRKFEARLLKMSDKRAARVMNRYTRRCNRAALKVK